MSRPSRKPTLWTQSIDPDQPKHAAQANPDRHFSRRNVSARIRLRGLRRLIWVDTLHRVHNVSFLNIIYKC